MKCFLERLEVIGLASLSILMMGLGSCVSKKAVESQVKFLLTTKKVSAESRVNSAAYFKSYIFCLQSNGRLLVLDTTLKKNDSLTNKYSGLIFNDLIAFNDTLFVLDSEANYFIVDQHLSINKYVQPNPFKYHFPNLKVHQYYIYSCGEESWEELSFFGIRKAIEYTHILLMGIAR